MSAPGNLISTSPAQLAQWLAEGKRVVVLDVRKQPAFDKKYTVFGRVIDGIKNAEVIMGAPTVQGTPRPSDKVVIKSVTLQPRAWRSSRW